QSLNPNTALDDQIQIIRSSKLMYEVVRKNKFYITYHESGRFHNIEVLRDDLPFSLQILNKSDEQQELLSLNFDLKFLKDGTVEVKEPQNSLIATVGKPFAWAGETVLITKKDGKSLVGR